MPHFLDEFRKFILRGNMVDLAVGVVIGAAFSKIVDSVAADLFMPLAVNGVGATAYRVAGTRNGGEALSLPQPETGLGTGQLPGPS